MGARIAHAAMQAGFEQRGFAVAGFKAVDAGQTGATVGQLIDLGLDSGQGKPGGDMRRPQRERFLQDGEGFPPVVVRVNTRRQGEQEVRIRG